MKKRTLHDAPGRLLHGREIAVPWFHSIDTVIPSEDVRPSRGTPLRERSPQLQPYGTTAPSWDFSAHIGVLRLGLKSSLRMTKVRHSSTARLKPCPFKTNLRMIGSVPALTTGLFPVRTPRRASRCSPTICILTCESPTSGMRPI